MKSKLIFFVVFSILLSLSIFSYAASVLLSGATTTGAGGYVQVDKAKDHTLVATLSNVSSLTIALQGSLDRTTWPTFGSYSITAADITNGYAVIHESDEVWEYVRPNITKIGGANASVTATVLSR